MSRTLERALRSWLRRETGGGGEGAERALALVFRALPRPLPPPGFVDAVLLRAGLLRRAAGRDLAAPRLKALVAVSCALAALATPFLPSLVRALGATLKPGKLIDLAAGALTGLVQRSAEAVKVWEALARMGEIVGATLASPAWLATFSLAVLLGLAAFRLLHSLLLEERSYRHAGI